MTVFLVVRPQAAMPIPLTMWTQTPTTPAHLYLDTKAPLVRASVSMEKPTTHFYQVEMVFPPTDATIRRLSMPTWIPGSYKIRDFAKNIEQFQAFDSSDKPLSWRKQDKATWAVEVPAGEALKVRYSLFAYEFSVRTSYLDSFYGFLNPASAFLYEEGKKHWGYRIKVKPAADWTIATALPKLDEHLFLADNLDVLIDSPMMFGPLRRHEFDVKGIPHYWVIAGDVNKNEAGMVEALQKIGTTVGDLFGDFPFDRYYFLTAYRLDGARGGLEHANSTLVHANADHFRTRDGWDRFLSLMIHEYYHAWNVKAIRDQSLSEFDYQREQYTELLWLHEGWTSYYDTILMNRAGFWDAKRGLAEWSKVINGYNQRPGNHYQSLAEASFNAWIHYYHPSFTTKNSQTDYYRAGSLSGLALDLLIRHKSKNERSLDTVMARLYRDFGAQRKPINWDLVARILQEVGGKSAVNFLDTYIRQANPLPMEKFLGYAGIEVAEAKVEETEEAPHQPPKPVSLGIQTKTKDDAVFVRHVWRGSSGWQAGLDFGDEILAINNRRVTASNYDKILQWSHPGDEIQVLVSRGNHILTVPVTLEEKQEVVKLKFDGDKASDLQTSIFQALFPPDSTAKENSKQETSWHP
ncbi:M61 family metallopeptidase [Sulfidibacter corallicola]|uniref:M61 family metallopeptidase n=1 Tax=Sulfidibacter corallicola TaxID=2818388 RepID=A0A8A4TYH6_SULCO|nr:M61 family metallopeptidase [Sulfidibacter corallicola]